MSSENNNKVRILSIDGGGIRGVIPGQVLVYVEQKIQELTGNQEARIADYFDFIAGTSTGGILSCAYLAPDSSKRPKFTAQEVVNLYMERGDDIFDIPLFHKLRTAGGLTDEKYPSAGIEEALEDYFGDVKLSELLKPCLVTAYDIKRREAKFFRQHDTRGKSRDFYVRDVARATGAAPTYFECARIKSMTNVVYPLIDGGLFANNPALCAYSDVRKFDKKPTAKSMAILSLGTGYAKKSYSYSEAKDFGMIDWIVPSLDIMMSGVSETVHYQLKQIYETTQNPNQYLRINTALPQDVNAQMDDASPENLQALKELGTELSEVKRTDLDAFIKNYLIR